MARFRNILYTTITCLRFIPLSWFLRSFIPFLPSCSLFRFVVPTSSIAIPPRSITLFRPIGSEIRCNQARSCPTLPTPRSIELVQLLNRLSYVILTTEKKKKLLRLFNRFTLSPSPFHADSLRVSSSMKDISRQQFILTNKNSSGMKNHWKKEEKLLFVFLFFRRPIASGTVKRIRRVECAA